MAIVGVLTSTGKHDNRYDDCITVKIAKLIDFVKTTHSHLVNVNVGYSVSQKNPPLRLCGNFTKALGNFSTKFQLPITRSYLR